MTRQPRNAIEPLVQGSLSSRAYIALREGLTSGKFRPGQRLIMQELASQMGTSITPVREACMRLVAEGGLILKSGRFAIVPPMTLERYMEVRMMRLELEGLAAALAAERAGKADIERLHAIHADYVQMDASPDLAAAYETNREFHFAVYRIPGMPLLASHIESLWVSMGPMLTAFFANGDRRYYGAEAHLTIIRAIEAGDAEAARRALRRDIIDGGEDFLRFLEAHPGYSVE
ncbi:GntR family transcriptional regulator [Poseidonocella sp. HB161398]|uniref:GntR family transcriptional regulator n=1 Tax=Poseidonocella sp. HB161398 TaxID=2320855 RepID=UPI0019816757|nr:GntR family transcriptional regulator [Poseidonocella sp. HB161398]